MMTRRSSPLLATLLLGGGLACFGSGCSVHSLSDEAPANEGPALSSSIAAPGEARLFIGQDVDSIEAYASAVAAPQGIVSYTSLQSLEGLDAEVDTGGGSMHLAQLANAFPSVPIALGLYLVGALSEVNQGALDPNIDRLAAHLSAYPVPVLLRVGYEFDGPWNGYEPEPYRAAFVRIAQRFAAKGADNVELVWQAAGSCGGTYQQRPVLDWYPGDDVVDWIAASYFTQSVCQFSPLKQLLHLAREHQKPFLIAEATPQGYDASDGTYSHDGVQRSPKSAASIDADWYSPFFGFIADNLDVVRAATYINADWDRQAMWSAPYRNGYFGDSRVQVDAQLLERWTGHVAARHFE